MSFLGVHIGDFRCAALAVSERGDIVSAQSERYPETEDTSVTWSAVCAVMRRAASQALEESDPVVAIAPAATSNRLITLDQDDNPIELLDPARTEDSGRLSEEIDVERVFRITGSYGPERLVAWKRANRPAGEPCRLVLWEDFFIGRLTGTFRIRPIAGRTNRGPRYQGS